MIILPAIDLLGGRCVRLSKGEYDTAREVAADPLETAERFYLAGAEYLHTVDLDGAKHGEGQKENRRVIREIAKKGWFPVEIGGGIRTIDDISRALDDGATRVILGSAATDLVFLEKAVAGFGESIAVGIDAKDGLVATSGWTKTGTLGYLDFAKTVAGLGVGTIIFTDIGRDGMLTGPNTEMLKALRSALPGTALIASGGVKSAEDIRELKALGMSGAICGKSLYAGTLDLGEAIRAARD